MKLWWPGANRKVMNSALPCGNATAAKWAACSGFAVRSKRWRRWSSWLLSSGLARLADGHVFPYICASGFSYVWKYGCTKIRLALQPLGEKLVYQFRKVLAGVQVLKAARCPLVGLLPHQHGVAVPLGIAAFAGG